MLIKKCALEIYQAQIAEKTLENCKTDSLYKKEKIYYNFIKNGFGTVKAIHENIFVTCNQKCYN